MMMTWCWTWREENKMIIKCCECGRFMGEKEPLEDNRVTHSYCPCCASKAKKEMKSIKLRIELARKRRFYEGACVIR